MFRGSSAHLQEVNDVNCIRMQPLVSSSIVFDYPTQCYTATQNSSPLTKNDNIFQVQ
jgi:hypothetical protein